MKGKRYTTEEKIRFLREADRGERTIQAISQEANISKITILPVRANRDIKTRASKRALIEFTTAENSYSN